MSSRFYNIEPTLEDYWRGVILFGRNVQHYKFAFGNSLSELAGSEANLLEQRCEGSFGPMEGRSS